MTKKNLSKISLIEQKQKSDSDSEHEQTVFIKKNNRFNFISDSESESEPETRINKETKTNNKKPEINKETIPKPNNKTSETNKTLETNKIIEINKETKPNNKTLETNKILESNNKTKTNKEKNKFDITRNLPNKTNSIETLFAENIEVHVGGKKIIEDSDISINNGTKYFILGSNGIGKTSLIKYIYDKIKLKIDTLMIDQDIQIESTEQTIYEFMLDADPILFETKKQLEQLEKIDVLNDEQLSKYNELSELLYSKEWDKYVAESSRIINGMGFTNPHNPVNILSGGKRMILAIAKALLRKPDILILDEPTNHLDLDMVIWLTNYLSTYKKTLIIITHQIGLVNSLSDVIWYIGNPELTGNKIYTIRGKYDKLLKFLEQTEKETNKNWEKFTKKVEELRKKSTPKKIVDEYIKNQGVLRPPKPYIVNILFDNVLEPPGKNIIEFKDVEFSYGSDTKLTHELIYSGLDISLSMGSRMILVGPNGCGKTTFFKLINKDIKPTNGYIICDERLRIGYYNQQIMDNLPLELNSIEYLQKLNPKLDVGQCRNILGKLGIKKTENQDLPMLKISNLSGGQKARVSFGSVQMTNPHLILLDEPTNHLDLESIDGLIKGINEFNGGIVIITHDIYLIESIERADIYQLVDKNIVKFPGEFEDYCEMIYSKY